MAWPNFRPWAAVFRPLEAAKRDLPELIFGLFEGLEGK